MCLSGGGLVPLCQEEVDTLAKSVYLLIGGATTTGTVTNAEEFSGGSANSPRLSYKLTVSFEVNGSTYFVTSNGYYDNLIGESWVGQPMQIVYDHENPDIALINSFRERWLEPIVGSAP